MRRFLIGLGCVSLVAALPADAEWFEARTGHFQVIIDETEAGARDYAMRLERFDLALRRLYDVADNPERHAVPVRIFALKDELFARTCRCGMSVLGYYQPRMGGSVIFTAHMPESDRKAKPGSWSSQMVLLHEYGHHFMFSNYPLAYPYWFAEGFAEFNANVIYNPDLSITIGIPANYRAEALNSGGKLSFRQFFEPRHYGFGSRPDLIYGRGWLMTHYLVLNSKRQGQLATYLSEMNRGRESLVAATTAFGNPEQLYDEVVAYGRGILAPPLRIPPPANPVEVKLRRLSEGEAAMLPVHAASTSGVSQDYLLRHAVGAREIAGRFPKDPAVQTQLAEAEFIAGRYDRAEAAADQALALDPASVEALVYKGRAAMGRASEAKSTDPAVWTAARNWFLKANRLAPNAARALYFYYLSYRTAKAKPTANAVKALSRAHVLSPESEVIRVMFARQMLEDGDAISARYLLQPLAFKPHRKRDDNVALRAITLIDAGKHKEALTALAGGKAERPGNE